MSEKTISINGNDFTFNVGNSAVNKYLNSVSEKDKITPSVNFLLSTVAEGDKEALKKTILDEDNTPKGLVVLSVVGLLVGEAGAEIEVTLKK